MNYFQLTLLFCMMVFMNVKAETLMIAHAGGGYEKQNYTNSIEALNLSYQNGFRYIEMDFSWTSDDQLVCLHDWEKTFKNIFKRKVKEPQSLNQFEQLVEAHPKFKSCTLDTLAAWLADKPDVKVITDIKYHNLKGIRMITTRFPELKAQLIPQFYQPEEYQVLKDLGFNDLIWILYQYKGSKKSVVKLSQDMKLFAVSMRARQAKSRTFQKLLKDHRIFVYTINDEKTKTKLTDRYQVTGIYTDYLPFDAR